MSEDDLQAFERLHPALQHHIVNSLGWPGLRPTQSAAIGPVLSDQHCILVAPTAGGKTEAAVFPVLSKILSEGWTELSVLYVCPIRALLNNLEPRLAHYFSLVGRRVGVWHGDVNASVKRKLLKDPPDLLLTTPESLEGMLISADDAKRDLLSGVRLVIVDELHAFCGDDRGWHVRCLIQRLAAHTGAFPQVLGLTATVGNPKALIDWLVPGRPTCVIGDGHSGVNADITIDYVASLANAATVIARLHQGEKRLVFCDSRAKTEEIAALLRAQGVRTFVSHSSLSADERRQAERAFAEEPNCVIVATSTLELGIDVGDLDRVIQIDAPQAVSSFLQRMGRTGRRSGTVRNCLFLATEDEGLLIASAIIRMWREGYVEPVVPPPAPWHIVAQQAMAIVLQHRGVTVEDLRKQLYALFPELSVAGIDAVIATMLERSILWNDQGLLYFGEAGEKDFGRRNFESVVSTFNSPLLMAVLHGQRELGYVDPMMLKGSGQESPKLTLAGRYWRIVSFDWKGRTVWVEPSDDKGRASWVGSSRSLRFALCQSMRKILCDGEVPATLSKRAVARLEELTESFAFLNPERSTIVRARDGRQDLWRWWTFAGGGANFALRDIAAQLNAVVRSSDNLSIRFDARPSIECWASSPETFSLSEGAVKALRELATELKFNACLPDTLLLDVMRSRALDLHGAAEVLRHGAAYSESHGN